MSSLITPQQSTYTASGESLHHCINNICNDLKVYPLIAVCLYFREEEIIMPDEHVGVVKENYQWKVGGS